MIGGIKGGARGKGGGGYYFKTSISFTKILIFVSSNFQSEASIKT
jgi:hypothetical protein